MRLLSWTLDLVKFNLRHRSHLSRDDEMCVTQQAEHSSLLLKVFTQLTWAFLVTSSVSRSTEDACLDRQYNSADMEQSCCVNLQPSTAMSNTNQQVSKYYYCISHSITLQIKITFHISFDIFTGIFQPSVKCKHNIIQ